MLKHVSFITAHPGALVAFYALLGARLVKDTTDPDGLRRLVLEFENGGKLQFFEGETPPRPTSWMEHVAVQLPDLHGTLAALRSANAVFSRELHLSPAGNPVAFVLDPDGRQVELLQRK